MNNEHSPKPSYLELLFLVPTLLKYELISYFGYIFKAQFSMWNFGRFEPLGTALDGLGETANARHYTHSIVKFAYKEPFELCFDLPYNSVLFNFRFLSHKIKTVYC